MAAAGLWAIAAFAQTPPEVRVIPPPPGMRPEAPPVLRPFIKNYRPNPAAVCSILLVEVPVAKEVEFKIRKLRPSTPVEPMPSVPVPAPPCKEEKR